MHYYFCKPIINDKANKKRATKELKEERVCSCRERKKREGEKTELLKIDEGEVEEESLEVSRRIIL